MSKENYLSVFYDKLNRNSFNQISYFFSIQFLNAFAKRATRCDSRSILGIFRTKFSGNGLRGSEIEFPTTDFHILMKYVFCGLKDGA